MPCESLNAFCQSMRLLGMNAKDERKLESYVRKIARDNGNQFLIDRLKILKQQSIEELQDHRFKFRQDSKNHTQTIRWNKLQQIPKGPLSLVYTLWPNPERRVATIGAMLNTIVEDNITTNQLSKLVGGVNSLSPDLDGKEIPVAMREGSLYIKGFSSAVSHSEVFSGLDLTGSVVPVGNVPRDISSAKRDLRSKDPDLRVKAIARLEKAVDDQWNYCPPIATNFMVKRFPSYHGKKFLKSQGEIARDYEYRGFKNKKINNNQIFHFYGRNAFDTYAGTVSFLQKPGGKLRTVYNANRALNRANEPYAKGIENAFYNLYPHHVYVNRQDKGMRQIQTMLRHRRKLVSADLTSATDYLAFRPFENGLAKSVILNIVSSHAFKAALSSVQESREINQLDTDHITKYGKSRLCEGDRRRLRSYWSRVDETASQLPYDNWPGFAFFIPSNVQKHIWTREERDKWLNFARTVLTDIPAPSNAYYRYGNGEKLSSIAIDHELDLALTSLEGISVFERTAEMPFFSPDLDTAIGLKTGQPLGMAGSFQTLTAMNFLAGKIAAEKHNMFSEGLPSFVVVGDDFVGDSEIMDDYHNVITSWNGVDNHEKAMKSSRYAEFCSHLITKNHIVAMKPRFHGIRGAEFLDVGKTSISRFCSVYRLNKSDKQALQSLAACGALTDPLDDTPKSDRTLDRTSKYVIQAAMRAYSQLDQAVSDVEEISPLQISLADEQVCLDRDPQISSEDRRTYVIGSDGEKVYNDPTHYDFCQQAGKFNTTIDHYDHHTGERLKNQSLYAASRSIKKTAALSDLLVRAYHGDKEAESRILRIPYHRSSGVTVSDLLMSGIQYQYDMEKAMSHRNPYPSAKREDSNDYTNPIDRSRYISSHITVAEDMISQSIRERMLDDSSNTDLDNLNGHEKKRKLPDIPDSWLSDNDSFSL